MKKRKRSVFYVLEENPVYREIIPLCISATIPNSQIRTFVHPHEMLTGLSIKPDLLVSEYSFTSTDFNGERILHLVKDKSPKTRVIFLTAHHNVSAAINAIRAGAMDYIPKSKNALDILIQKFLDVNRHLEYIRKSNRTISRLTLLLALAVMALAGFVLWYKLN